MEPDWIPLYSGCGATCSGSTIAPDWVPLYSGFSAVSGATIAPDCSPLYSGKEARVSDSTIEPACVPWYSDCGSTFSGSTIAPDWVPLYSGFSAVSGSTIAPDCSPLYSGKEAWDSGSPFLVENGVSLGTTAFFVPFSTTRGKASSTLVERISRAISCLSTVKMRTSSIFFPARPSCLTWMVPSASSGFSWTTSAKSSLVSISCSLYRSSGLFTRPAKTSSWGSTLARPDGFGLDKSREGINCSTGRIWDGSFCLSTACCPPSLVWTWGWTVSSSFWALVAVSCWLISLSCLI